MAAAPSLTALDLETKQLAFDQRAALLRAASVHCAAFCAYVLRDEETGKPIQLADMHVEWHDLIDAENRVLIWSHVEAGKTQQVSVGRTLFELGRDSSKRIVILSKTQGQAIKIIRSIQKYIERSAELREVFPHLFPSIPWTSTQLVVQREVFSKDYSVQAIGVGGAVMGSRWDVVIIDDILDWQNTRTPAKREELARWFKSEIVGRLTADAKVVVCGNAYHPEDFLHKLAREGYVARTYPIELADGSPRFPGHWTKRRIAAKRIELGPIEAARQLDCVARKDADVRCKEEWIRQCLARGVGVPLLHSLDDGFFADGSRTFTGVDIGVGKKKKDGKTVVFTIAVNLAGDRRLLGVESGRWGGLEIVQRVLDHHLRYRSIVFVEDNGAQKHILEFAHEAARMREKEARAEFRAKAAALLTAGGDVLPELPEMTTRDLDAVTALLAVLPFHTGTNKTHPTLGVESIFAEFAAARWVIPCTEKQPGQYVTIETISEWLAECENYDPQRHTGDHLMASWFSREGARTHTIPQDPDAGVRIIGDSDDEEIDPARAEELEGWEAILPRRH